MSVFDAITKPTLLLDETRARANLQVMADKAAAQQVRFRPHFKTHMSAEIGEWFRQAGVHRITVSSVDMGLYFAANGWEDITLAFSANPRQTADIARLAGMTHLGLLVESQETLAMLEDRLAALPDASLDLWIKIDVGNARTGIAWESPQTAAALVQAAGRSPLFNLRGLLTHSGHTYNAESPQRVRQIYAEGVERLTAVRDFIATQTGIQLEISVGDTPGCSLCEDFGAVNEIRPGNFIFFDAQQLRAGSCRADQIAVALACPVVAVHPSRAEVVIYGGAVHLSKDFVQYPQGRTYGLPAFPTERGWSDPIPGGEVRGLSQEHGKVYLPEPYFSRVKVGDLLMIIPAHSCLTVAAMRSFMTLDGLRLETCA